jgi:hypothetical protein
MAISWQQGWCGAMPGGWWDGGWVPPCALESANGAALLLAALLTCAFGAAAIRRRELLAAGGLVPPGKTGMTGREAALVIGSLVLAALHLAHALGAAATGQAPAHLGYQAGALTAWLALAALAGRAARTHAAPRYWPLLALAVLAYCAGLYEYLRLYLAAPPPPGAPPPPFPPAYVRAALWTQLLQAALSSALLGLQLRGGGRGGAAGAGGAAAAAAGYAPLADVEAGAG